MISKWHPDTGRRGNDAFDLALRKVSYFFAPTFSLLYIDASRWMELKGYVFHGAWLQRRQMKGFGNAAKEKPDFRDREQEK